MLKQILILSVILGAISNISAMQPIRRMSKTQNRRFERELRKEAEIDELVQQHDALLERELELRCQQTWTEVCLDLPAVICFCVTAYATPAIMRAGIVSSPPVPPTQTLLQITECLCGAYLLPHACCGLVQRERQNRIAKIKAERDKIKLLLQEKTA